jgi:hypothetical protein
MTWKEEQRETKPSNLEVSGVRLGFQNNNQMESPSKSETLLKLTCSVSQVTFSLTFPQHYTSLFMLSSDHDPTFGLSLMLF